MKWWVAVTMAGKFSTSMRVFLFFQDVFIYTPAFILTNKCFEIYFQYNIIMVSSRLEIFKMLNKLLLYILIHPWVFLSNLPTKKLTASQGILPC